MTFGLRHIRKWNWPKRLLGILTLEDVLNRYPYTPCTASKESYSELDWEKRVSSIHLNTLHILMYIFPRQFGLHNVFTSTVDFRETAQPFKDYTMREDEIRILRSGHRGGSGIKTPKRLRGIVAQLVQKLQILHQRCPYHEIVQYYCPSNVGLALVGQRTELTFPN